MEPPQSRTNPIEPSLLLFSSDGALVRKLAGVTVFSWLPDSSGLFVAITIPQRAPDLSIVEIDGRLITTQVQLADETLTRDGKWIVAEHQEGCCVSIVQREIRVSSRDGRVVRTLVRSDAAEPQPVALVGVDGADRVVYRDVDRLMRIPLAGGTPTVIASSPDLVRTVGASTSPDGAAMLIRGYQPDRWYVLASDRLAPWDPALGEPVADPNVSLMKSSPAALWSGPHALLVRAPDGALSAYDTIAATRSALAARLVGNDTVLAYGHGAVLVLRGRQPVLIDLASGAVRESGLDAGSDARVSSSTLPGGGFLLSTASSTYRLD